MTPPDDVVLVARWPGAVPDGEVRVVLVACPDLPGDDVVDADWTAVVELVPPETEGEVLPRREEAPRPPVPVWPLGLRRLTAAGIGVVNDPAPSTGGAVLALGATTGPRPGSDSRGAHGARARLAPKRTR